MTRVLCTAPLLVAALASMTSCSDSSSGNAFHRDAIRICSRYGKRLEAIAPPAGPTGPYLSKTAAVLEQMHEAFRKLQPPPAQAQRFRTYLGLQAQSLRQMQQLVRFVRLNEPRAFAALKRQKPRLHVSPAKALAHPTAATIAEAMSIPAVGRYMRGLDRLERSFGGTATRGERLAKQLGFTSCR